jgi:Tol biopolymer transport system component
MMPSDRFELLLPELLDQVGGTRTPDYFDDLLQQTARTRQRPAWSFPERWIPMLDIARQPIITRRMSWRPIVVLALIATLLAALVFVVGSQRRLPPPFGLAANGLVAYASAGDIYTADPVTGASRLIVGGANNDTAPLWSLDGTHIAFFRGVNTATSNEGGIYVADADGGNVTRVTTNAMVDVSTSEFSPDGRSILISGEVGPHRVFSIAAIDGSGARTIDLHDLLPAGLEADAASYRPPNGSEILFTAYQNDDKVSSGGIYLVNADGSNLRTLFEPERDKLIFYATWSPDGSRIAYTTVFNRVWRTSVMSVDDKVNRVLHKEGAQSEGWATWSPDGTRLILQRVNADQTNTYVVVRADGTGPDVEILQDAPPDGAHYIWSPDAKSIMAAEDNHPRANPLVWDADTGVATRAPWTAESYPTWQRLAP